MPHECDKALIIDSIRSQVGELFEQGRERESRLTEMEATLYGAERNGGGGFIHDTKETLEVVRLGVSTMSEQVKALTDKKSSARATITASIPALIAAVATIVVVLLK